MCGCMDHYIIGNLGTMGISIKAPVVALANKSTDQSENFPEFQQLELFAWKIDDPFLEANDIPTSQVRRKDGRICLNDMWRVAGSAKNKIPSRWIHQKQTQVLILLLQSEISGDVYRVKRGKNGGTFAVDELAYKYWEYLRVQRPVKLTEKQVQKRLAKNLGDVKREVPTLTGKIDILTDNELIEVKSVNSWKCAVGQVLIYGQFYPNYQKRIHLFGEASPNFLSMIRSHCTPFDIEVTWEF